MLVHVDGTGPDLESTQEALERARRTLHLLTRCSEALLRAESQQALFDEACRIIVEIGGYRMCWVGIAEDDERRTVRPVAQAGYDDGFLAQADMVWADVPRGRGPTGTAVRDGRLVVGRSFASDPLLAPWKAQALRRGYVSSTALPIAFEGERVGVISMYSGDPAVFGPEDLPFLRHLADDLGFRVVALRRRSDAVKAEQALRESEASLRQVFDLNPDAANINRLEDGRYIAVNDSFLRMTGWTREEVLGRPSVDLGIWKDPADRDRMIAQLEEKGFVQNFEARFRTRSGMVLDGLMSARLMTLGGESVILSITRDVTDWRRNERRYRLLAEHSLDVIWTMDLSTMRLNYVSPSIQRLRGLTVEEALAEPLDESFTAESLARAGEIMARSTGPGGASSYTGVFDQPCADGSLKHVEITASYLRDEAGRPVEILGVSRDATARIEAERALEQREREMRTILHTALDGFGSVDGAGRFREVNEALGTITGYSRDELLGMRVADLEEVNGDGEFAARMARIRDSGPERFETRYRRKDGRIIDVEVSARFSDVAGGSIHAFFRDVTEQRRSEAALRGSEARFRTLIERSTEMIVLLDGEARITFWSPSATEALGWEAGEVHGTVFLDLAHPDDRAGAAAIVKRILAGTGSTPTLALRVRHKAGGWRSIDGPCRNLLADPAVRALVLNTRDMTAHNLLEAQFLQAQKLESVGRLAGGVAHDFNNLLTVILSSSEIMRQDRAAGLPVDDEEIEQIHTAGERARDLTRQLLAFARKQLISPTSLDLNAVVRGSEKLLHRVLGEDVRLVVNADPGLWPTLCDAGQIEQILMNLAVNARDAMPGGGVLTVETRNAEVHDEEAARDPDRRPGSWVRLILRDSGVGMSPEAMAHLFEPFFTTKERGKGTGLGLATVHGIVEQSGGHIHVESQPGAGTTFEICFPRSDAPQVTKAPAPEAPSVRGHETILVVEDDPQVRGVTIRALEASGYRVIPAASGEEALVIARQSGERLDMVVTDVVMPGLTGREVVDELRRSLPDIPALFVSGYTQDAIAQRGVLDSGVEFLPKPFTPSTLVARVRAMLDTGRPGG